MTATPRDAELAKRKIFELKDAESQTPERFSTGYQTGVPIAIDFGSSTIRAGLVTEKDPFLNFPTIMSKYRDRKTGKSSVYVGNDVLLDPSVKSQARSPYDGAFITNWDYVENILDYTFRHLGVDSQGFVDNPLILTERPGASLLQRKGMYEVLYESYGAQKVCLGIDSLFSYYQNGGNNGLVIGTGHETTHVFPVINGKAVMSESKRVNWGGHQASNYLNSLLALKYPYFPTKITSYQVDNMVKDFCYVSKDYQKELSDMLNLDVLEEKDITCEAPFVEVEKQQKSPEELARQAEKRKESGRRLQEQAQQKRLEKLIQKEQEHEYYTQLKQKLTTMNKKLQASTIKDEGFEDERDLNKYIASLENSLRRARKQDVGDEPEEEPTFPLLEVPDDQLDEEQLKEKRKQKLMKANYDARQRAKQEKEDEKVRVAEEAKKDAEWRENDLGGWIHDRREKLKAILQRRKDRQKLKEQLSDRKSLAAQMRMKSIASLAADETVRSSGAKRKRNGATIDNDPNDTFGANDDDWAIYRDISTVDDEEIIEEEDQEILKLEKELLEYDPNFTEEDTLEAQFDWRKSILHRFLRGPRPFNSEDSHENHQVHLNVERIRIPEVIFQPTMAGIDQASVVEIGENILLNRLSGSGFSGDSYNVLQDIFATGGQALFQNFDDRLHSEFKSFLPSGAPLKVRLANDPLCDAWRGMAKWGLSDESKDSYLTKAEYDEMGPDYIKEHRLGNVNVIQE
ncbi:ARP5 [Cyberlindnera jadinii]|uniref:ARP5 protein n=1 Tax=Cyberlindnera jadinii (strain ATCC 18201 / CBS 1600 / BCRC 20928 / JCM 3617 / NBRC 0987 / NRRL Y-1542) TaxID=983966 RepID=A0A0H5CAE4_CYBJN|nr:actin-like ATPase domain-containing protein [Cyberlindnera jadinii NRRL Y-1542]ODV75784.1 actin-like ATPase domain-containing protein [Cyberlindnera jadinii NRRL Y-1542]CEP20499.1 ARP5 [Cyberlindnera jadinii]